MSAGEHEFVQVASEKFDEDNVREKFHQYLVKRSAVEDHADSAIPTLVRQNSFFFRKPAVPTQIFDIDIKNFHQDQDKDRYGKAKTKNTNSTLFFKTKSKYCCCGCVLNPDNIYRQMWDLIFVTSCLLYTVLRVPYVIAFDIDEFASENLGWFIMNRIVDTVFLSDIIIIFFTAFQDGRHYVIRHKLIACQYLTTWFFLDLIASVPLDLIFWSFGDTGESTEAARSAKLFRIIKIFRTLRILRLFKLKRVLLALEIFLNFSFPMMSIFKFFGGIALSAHFLACGFVLIGMEEDNGWITEPNIGTTNKQRYIASLYWAITTMTTIGYGDVAAITSNERIFATCCGIFGGIIFTYGVTRVVGIVSTMGKSKTYLRNQLESLKEWSEYHDFDDDLMNDIRTYLHYKNTQMYYNEAAVISSLSLPLQKRINQQIYSKSMEEIELFKHIKNSAFLSEIILKLKSEFAQPYQLICKQGEVADSMYMIRKGVAASFKGVKVKDIKSAALMSSGQGFDEIALLADNVFRLNSVVSLDWCDLAFLTKQDFTKLIEYFPKQRKKLEEYAAEQLDEYIHQIKEQKSSKNPISVWNTNNELTMDDMTNDEKTDFTFEANVNNVGVSRILSWRSDAVNMNSNNDSSEIMNYLKTITAQLHSLKEQVTHNTEVIEGIKRQLMDKSVHKASDVELCV